MWQGTYQNDRSIDMHNYYTTDYMKKDASKLESGVLFAGGGGLKIMLSTFTVNSFIYANSSCATGPCHYIL